MVEMLRNWREPAMSALIYQIIKAGNFTFAKIHIHKKGSGNHAFLSHIKESFCRKYGKCRKYNRKQVFTTFCKCPQRGRLE